MEKSARIFVSSHKTMVGAALVRCLQEHGYSNLLTADIDLTAQQVVAAFFHEEKPDYVFLPSLKSGGIMANREYPGEFLYDNLQSQTNVIHAAWHSGVKKLLYLGSSCIYPKDCPQPMKEEYLLTGRLEPTSEAYAIAKIAGIRMCQAYNTQYGTHFIPVVPADLYGPGDDFDPATSHVLPALLAKMHDAKVKGAEEVVVWGTGFPRREALYVDDLADACIFLMNGSELPEMINVGSGKDFSISELARVIKDIIGFTGKISYDEAKPDGAPQKLLDSSRVQKLGWKPRVSLAEGVQRTYRWYRENIAK
ncbi:GDP-L-fucose synthase family protein [Chloroflexota bacterium]